MKESAKYLKVVEWSEADVCYVGSAPGIIGQCCHGDDEAAVYAELCQIVDEWIETIKKDGLPLPDVTAGKSYSGKFVLRMDAELHKGLAIRAVAHGKSLNQYCVQQLSTALLPLTPEVTRPIYREMVLKPHAVAQGLEVGESHAPFDVDKSRVPLQTLEEAYISLKANRQGGKE